MEFQSERHFQRYLATPEPETQEKRQMPGSEGYRRCAGAGSAVWRIIRHDPGLGLRWVQHERNPKGLWHDPGIGHTHRRNPNLTRLRPELGRDKEASQSCPDDIRPVKQT